VIEETDQPVLIVKETATSLDRMLLCDGGEQQTPILHRFENQLPEFLDAAREVTVLHVMSQITAKPGVADEHLLATAEELIAASAHEGEVLEYDLEHLQQLEATPRPLVRHGLVVDEIVDEAASGAYDLVVIGAHRQEPWTDLLLDDLAAQIVREIDQTVLLIR
jgi:nucleotide-binding universal stress UspA family protein